MEIEQIIEELKHHTGSENDNQLGEFLGVGRQGIYQYKRKKTQDIQTKIIVYLLEKLKENNEPAKKD